MIIYVNGNYIDDNNPAIFASDRGFLLGDGIFTTLKVISSQLQHFQLHYLRLKSNCDIIQLPFNFTEEAIRNICYKLIAINHLQNEILTMRISLTRGKSLRGIDIPESCSPTIMVTLSLFPKELPASLSLHISSFIRNDLSPIVLIKSTNYLESILARQEARQANFDDGLFINTKSNICETTTSNIFFIQGKTIYTPPVSDGVLPGITRSLIFKMAHELGIPFIQASINPKDINMFDECFITNCIAGLQKINMIGNTVFKQQNITMKLKNHYLSVYDSVN